jgi:hypothetical protein
MIDRFPCLSRLETVLKWFERFAMRNAKAAAVVCEALIDGTNKRPEKVVVLPDITLLEGFDGLAPRPAGESRLVVTRTR